MTDRLRAYRAGPNPDRHTCQWCTNRPDVLFAFRTPATTVRICRSCRDVLTAALRTAAEFDDASHRVEAVMSDDAVAESARRARSLGRIVWEPETADDAGRRDAGGG